MRRVAACVVLLAAGGCNQVYGIDPTTPIDGAGPGLDAPPVPNLQLHVTYQQMVIGMDGRPQDLAFPVLPGPVSVKVGRVGGALVDATGDATGVYEIKLDPTPTTDDEMHAVITAPMAGIPPTDLFWKVGPSSPWFVVPRFERQGASGDEVPSGSGWQVALDAPHDFSRMLGLTTGAWTEGVTDNPPQFLSPVRYPFADVAVSLVGPRALPDAAKGDQVVLIAMPTLPSAGPQQCDRSSTGSVTFSPPMLTMGGPTTLPGPNPTWIATTARWKPDWNVGAVQGGFIGQLDALGSDGSTFTVVDGGRAAFGYLPRRDFPAYLRTGGRDDRGRARPLPVPAMLTVSDCPYGIILSDPFALVPALESPTLKIVEAAAHLQLTSTRTVTARGVTLTSGLDIAVAPSILPDGTRLATFEIPGRAPMPMAMKIARGTKMMDLTTDADATDMTGTGPLALTWGAHTEMGEVSDYWSITLVRLEGATHTPVRVIDTSIQAVELAVDGLPAGEYTLEIRAHTGYPRAARGDYTVVTFPQTMTTVSTRTFRL